jgi:hypothetical protein
VTLRLVEVTSMKTLDALGTTLTMSLLLSSVVVFTPTAAVAAPVAENEQVDIEKVPCIQVVGV